MDPQPASPSDSLADPSTASADPSVTDRLPAPPAQPEPLGPAPFEPPSATPGLIPSSVERLGVPVGAAFFIPADRSKAPSYVFLVLVSVLTLASDIGSKVWAEKSLDAMPGPLEVWKDHVAFLLAKNRGGAWGLLQSTNENVRRPFFLLVSAAAIAFIVTLYRRLLPTQRALKWGLPLVLGGALGNVFDRIRYGHVIDFIDVHVTYKGEARHWPTFNVADIAICVGVGLMAIDMFTSKKPKRSEEPPPFGPLASETPALALPPETSALAPETSALAPEPPALAPDGSAPSPETAESSAPKPAD